MIGTGMGMTQVAARQHAAAVVAPTIALSSVSAQNEGASGTTAFVYTLTLTRNGSTAAIPFAWAVTGSGSSPADASDFGGTFPSGSGTFASGETSKTITVLASGDAAIEPDEAFLLTVTSTGAGTATAAGTILNDDVAVTLQQMVALKTAYGKTLDGAADTIVLIAGDSTTMGRGAGGSTVGPATDNARGLSTPTRFAVAMAAKGYAVSCDGFLGANGVGSIAEFNAYFTALAPLTGSVVFSAGWTLGGNPGSVGGVCFLKATATAGPCTFTPVFACDTVDVWYLDLGTGTQMVVKADGTTIGTVTTTATSTLSKATFTIPAGVGAHVITVDSVTSAQIALQGIITRSSATKRLIVINGGIRGATAGNYIDATTNYAPRNGLASFKADWVDMSLGINDLDTLPGPPVVYNTDAMFTTFKNQMDILETVSAFAGDFTYRTPNRVDPGNDQGVIFFTDIDAWMVQHASDHARNSFGTFAIAGGFIPSTFGGPTSYNDNLHPKPLFYDNLGKGMADKIDAALTATPYTKLQLSGTPGTATPGFAYSWRPATKFGHGAITWAIDTGGTPLPAWASLNTSTGFVTGASPTLGTTSGIILKATDSTGTTTLALAPLVARAPLSDTGVGTAGTTNPPASDGTAVTAAGNFRIGTGGTDLYGSLTVTAPSGGSATSRLYNYSAGQPNQHIRFTANYMTATTANAWGGLRKVDNYNGYAAGYRPSINSWTIVKITNGGLIYLAAWVISSGTIVAGADYDIDFQAVGSTLSLTVNGTLIGSVIDGTYTEPGFVDLYTTSVSSVTTGPHIRNVVAGPV